ncbi:AAA family ATPase [Sphingobacteriales bacterium UPWRP_1]|nr:AAA family ATPase [Sphingobacteriales bacterium TSM_CSM]PSJ76999.1 AAA family ATPase [Sphingobacteriales bacterium UPWRP_1]
MDSKNPGFKPYKFKDLKVYGSSEWLANGMRKYRRVFERLETTFIYVELSFFNKLFDEEDWEADIVLKAYALKDKNRRELCNLNLKKEVSKEMPVVHVYQAWGNKRPGFFWKKGEYEWAAYLDGNFLGAQKFWIEDVGMVTEEENPYFAIRSIKLYEGPNDHVPLSQRNYYKVFDNKNTRYIFAEFTFENLAPPPWNCELMFKFFNDAHQLKGETYDLVTVTGTENGNLITVTSGWGSNDPGTWYADKYTLEVTFMDQLIAILPFEVAEEFEEGLNEAILPGTNTPLAPASTEDAPQSLEEVMKELEGLIGLSNIKTRIKEYAEYLKYVKIRIEKGIEDGHNINLHTIFTGNPGTGKTTVAKMLGQIYKNLGLLSKGHVHVVDRADLVGEYIGQTAPKVKEAIKQARGGILFIDEAYGLARAKDDAKDFGREVLEILIKEMSDGEGDLAVIVAGYPREMNTFIDTNPGLKSRFSQRFEFPDYQPQELSDIAEYAAEKRKVLLSVQAKAYLFDRIVEAYRTRDRYFGNARFVYGVIDQAKINLGLRIMKTENPRKLTREELSAIHVEDLEAIFRKKEKRLTDIPVDENILAEAMEELNALTGLAGVKREINELVKLVRFNREMNKSVLNRFSLHSVFVGNPGTGKTTVARILSKIFKALGILERGHLIECDRESLVAGYVGQTAIKTAEKIDQAIGGTLFIDEAYSLTQRGGGMDYGHEAIETLIKRMEDQKGEFAVVVAGYPDNMKLFMEANPGLKSRFDRTLQFEDFSVADLMEIAVAAFKKEGYEMNEEAALLLEQYFVLLYDMKDKFFGNGRTVVKTTEEIIKKQNLRLAAIPVDERTPEMLRTIIAEDLSGFDEQKAIKGGRKRLGFGNMPGGTSV